MKISSPCIRRKARIEIIPLIDVVFFLLATFMMVSLSTIKNLGVPVNLPSAASASKEDRSSAAVISLTRDGATFLDKEVMPLEQIVDRLATLKSSHVDLKVFINGDEETKFGLAVRVLDELRGKGITKIAIQTKMPQQK